MPGLKKAELRTNIRVHECRWKDKLAKASADGSLASILGSGQPGSTKSGAAATDVVDVAALKAEAKDKLALDKGKGFGILPNLTVKRGKLFGQVSKFNKDFEHDGCWVDPNSGKILLKLRGSDQGRVIVNTSDLVEINSNFTPSDWHFCFSKATLQYRSTRAALQREHYF